MKFILIALCSFLLSACDVPNCGDAWVTDSILEETVGDPELYKFIRIDYINEVQYNPSSQLRTCSSLLVPTHLAHEAFDNQRESVVNGDKKDLGANITMFYGLGASSVENFTFNYFIFYDQVTSKYRIKYQVDQAKEIRDWSKLVGATAGYNVDEDENE